MDRDGAIQHMIGLLEEGRSAEGLEIAESGLERNPRDLGMRLACIRFLTNLGRVDDAVEQMKLMVPSNELAVSAYIVCRELGLLNRTQDAMAVAGAAVELAPEWPHSHRWSARRRLRKAVRLDPNAGEVQLATTFIRGR